MTTMHFIAFWNMENLFDVNNSVYRPAYLQEILASELEGWDADVLEKKLKQLANIICAMHEGKGPDILGIAEVENIIVLKKLVQMLDLPHRDYTIAHVDSADGRGIDVAFIFDSYKYKAGLQFHYFVQKRTATRDIFQLNLRTGQEHDLVLICNHWPSRERNIEHSAPYRMMVGETLAYYHKRIVEEMGEDTAIVVMGDFNDEPFDRSIWEYALATRERQKLLNAKSVDYFYNLMWSLLGQKQASYYFGSQPLVLDQFWVSKAIIKTGGIFNVREEEVVIFKPEAMVMKGNYPRPRRFGRPSQGSNYDETGYSDHFPITMQLYEESV